MTLKTIIDDQNAIKQKLFILRQTKNGDSQKIDNIEKSLVKIAGMVSNPTSTSPSPTPFSDNSSKGSVKNPIQHLEYL